MVQPDTTPPLVVIAKPSTRDMRPLSARLANLTPEHLASILSRVETGELTDWADLCDRMVEVDAQIRASYETRLAAIAGARWYMEPGSPTGDRKRDRWAHEGAQFVERVVRAIDRFQVFVQESLDAIGKGVAAHEKRVEWDAGGGAFVVRDLEWVHTRRFRWSRSDWTLRLVDDGERYHVDGLELESDGWVVHTPKTVAGYPTRVGVMRPCSWPYLFKRWGVQFWVQGAESFAWPFLWAKVPRNASDEVRARALEGLEQLSADHRAVVEDPSAFELLETTVKDGGTWRDFHSAMNAEIAKAVLGMTDMNEPSRIGAYAAVEVRRGATVDARIAMDESAFATTLRTQLIEPLLRWNTHLFGGVMPPVPSIRFAIAAKQREIPPHAYSLAEVDEVRATLDLAPIGGARGKAKASDGLQPEEGPEPVDDGIAPDSIWIDTHDDHRIKVIRADAEFVYCVDLDSDTPTRQWRWKLATFLGRCTPAPTPVLAAPAA